MLLAAVLLLGALAGCGKETASSGAGSAAPDGSEAPAEAKVFHVKDYGAVGDGVADDYNAVKKALDEAIAYDGTKVVQFEKDATYLMAKVQSHGGKAAYMCIGSNIAAPHHNDHFNFDESSLLTGLRLYVSTVWEIMHR